MLTAEKLIDILMELDSQKELGCTFDFKERFFVDLKPLELLNFVTVIQTRIPACGDHCNNYSNCKWIPLFEQRKSASKFRLTKQGTNFASFLKKNASSSKEIKKIVKEELRNTPLVKISMNFLEDKSEVSIEEILSVLLENSNYSIHIFRVTLKDILDLMVSVELITVKEGLIGKF